MPQCSIARINTEAKPDFYKDDKDGNGLNFCTVILVWPKTHTFFLHPNKGRTNGTSLYVMYIRRKYSIDGIHRTIAILLF